MATVSDLLACLVAHDFSGAAQLLEAGVSIDARAQRNWPVVEWAFAKGDRAVVDWVLDQRPNVELRPDLMGSLLRHCQTFNDPDLLRRVLALGDPTVINQPDATGRPPLMRAIHADPFDLTWCKLLLDAGADANATGLVGDTLLMVALVEKRQELIPLLAKAGADPNLANQSGQVAAHAAAMSQKSKVVKTFLENFPGADLNRPAASGTPPIMMAHNPAAMGEFLKAGANANVRSGNPVDEHHTLLIRLVQSRAPAEVIGLALEQGADPLLEDDLGSTAMAYAVAMKRWDVVSQLYDHGFPFNAPLDRSGLSPYHLLLSEPEALAALTVATVLSRVPVDVGRREGPLKKNQKLCPSPLWSALNLGCLDHAALFMQAGAAPDARGPDGVPSFHGLVGGLQRHLDTTANQKVMEALVAARPEMSLTPAQDAAKVTAQYDQANLEQVLSRLASGALDWNASDAQGQTLAHKLIALDSPEWAVRLMALGASPVVPDADGWTALDRAILLGQVGTVHAWKSVLAQQDMAWEPNVGAWVLASPEEYPERTHFLRGMESLVKDPQWARWVNTPDEAGNTPLILAVATGQADVADFLLANGASATLTNALGETALHHAVEQGNLALVEHLRAANSDPYAPTMSGLSAWDLADTGAGISPALRAALDKPPSPTTWTPTPGLEDEVARGEQWGQKTPSSLVRRRRQP